MDYFSIMFRFLYVILLVTIAFPVNNNAQSCGGFVEATTDKKPSGTITSPGYPSNYSSYQNCIWLIEAPQNYSVRMNVTTGMAGESSCGDYLLITNGNSSAGQLYYGCNSATPVVIESEARWMWLRMFTDNDNEVNIGFSATWSIFSVSGGNANFSSPIADCQSVHYSCPNKECISWSYRCDGELDCGCDGSGCDEVGCTGLGLSQGAIVGIGISVGIVTFSAIFFGIGALEIYLKNRSEQDYQRKVKEARIRARQKKAHGDSDTKRQESVSESGPSRRTSNVSMSIPSRKNSTVAPSPK